MTRADVKRGLQRLLEGVVLSLMVGLALVVVVGVIFRKAGASLVWYDEVASIFLAWLTYYGAALAALHRGHIGMPTLVARSRGTMRKVLILVAEVVVVAFFVALAWAGVEVMVVLGGSSLVSLPWVPARAAQSVIPVGAVLFVVAQLVTLPDLLAGGGEEKDVEGGTRPDHSGGAA
ncbi:MAG: TRAP transporter small permease [Gemmatimonadota bacterium]|nr:TRAP transporter small permease [Gemmatimonadota bacterium]MDH5758436.1 TRAP transporter small permease [Gemmatimonadota bacterium]